MSTGRLGASNSKLGILVLGSPNTEFSGGFGQATALIDSPIKVQSATAQAFILKAKGLGQAQARIYAFNYPQFGQAQAKINAFGVQAYAQAAAWIAYTPGPNDGPHIQRIYRSNPLAVYRLGESSGATAVNAAHTGNGTYGGTITYSEAHTIEGDTDTAIAIGSSGNMTATVSSIPVTNGQPVTVAFWMHWSGTSDQMPFAWDVSYSDLYFNPGGTFGFNTGAGDTYGFSSSGLANKWVWVVAVFYHNQNYTTASKIYINGLSQTLSGSSATHTVGTSFRLSGWSAGGQHFVGSKVDDLVIWGREPSSAEILDIYNSSIPKQFAQAQALIIITKSGQAAALIDSPIKVQFGQAQADILQTYQGYAQAQAQIVKGTRAYAQAQGAILATVFGFAQAQADIKQIYYGFAQAQAQIAIYSWGFGQAQGDILATSRGYAQAQAFIDSYTLQFAQARALIDSPVKTAVGQTQAVIIRNKHAHAQAQGFIDSGTYSAYGLAQAYITFRGTFGQAEAYIIKLNNRKYAQAQARVIGYYNKHAQAQAMIAHKYATGQSQAIIQLTGRLQTGLAQAQITNRFPVGQAQAMIRSQRYLVMYNKYQLPGYAQGEAFNSPMKIVAHPTAYNDISFTEYLGLENKSISIRMLVTGETYLACKNQIQDAGTIIRSNRKGFAPLYVQAYDKHYEALGTSIKFEASVANIRSAEYTLEFEAKPWLISDTLTTISGTALVETTGRDLYNGTWTPTTIQVTGTNVTISGYTATGDFTGFVSISGAVNNLIINTDEYEATINGVNSTRVIRNVDYAIYVGPGMTYFDINGATDCVITYHDRWNL